MIYVCLTTISSRLRYVNLVVESLLAQSYEASMYEVRLYLSKESYLLDEGCTNLTPGLKRLLVMYGDRFSIHYTQNIGPYRKILPILHELYAGPQRAFAESLIATADDDTIYPPSWLEGLVSHMGRERCVVGYRGRSIVFEEGNLSVYRRWEKFIETNPSSENLLTGKDGILYSPLQLHPAVRNVALALATAPKADDLWLKAHALLLGCRSYIVNETLEDEFPSVTGTEPEVSLYRSFNQRGGNDEAARSIDAYLSRTFGTSLHDLCLKGPPPMARLTSFIS